MTLRVQTDALSRAFVTLGCRAFVTLGCRAFVTHCSTHPRYFSFHSADESGHEQIVGCPFAVWDDRTLWQRLVIGPGANLSLGG